MKLAHISDIHFGKIGHPEIVDTLVNEVNREEVDLVVVSGDLTQRAFHRQFRMARAMLDAFEAPTLVVPGNHDVHAWWRPHDRMVRPLERYQHYITKDLRPSFQKNGLAVLGINSAHGRTIMGGRISGADRSLISSYFQRFNANTFKVLVVHHHLTRIQALGPHDVARRARHALDSAALAGVDLVLCGHLHISHIEPVVVIPYRHRIVIVSAGTATSTRGRRSNRNTNFYNLIQVQEDNFVIEERRFDVDQGRFIVDLSTRFRRTT